MPTNVISIVGEGHSGSTLLDLILGSHPQVVSVGEADALESERRLGEACACGETLDACELWGPVLERFDRHLASSPLSEKEITTLGSAIRGRGRRLRYRAGILATMYLPIHRAARLFGALTPAMYQRALQTQRLYDIVREETGRPVVVDSSKSVNRFRLLHALEPRRNKAIFLTRDGRAFVAGNLKREHLGPAASAKEWQFTNSYTRRMLRAVPKSAYLHVRYEELCREPEAAVRRICTFVGIEFDESMLHFRERRSHNVGGNRMRLGGSDEIVEDVKWRQALTQDQLDEFERIGGRLNRELLGKFYSP